MLSAINSRWWAWPLIGTVALVAGCVGVPPLFGVKADYLWTDRLLLVLVVVTLFAIAYVRQREHLAGPWRQVFRRPLGMAALVVLSAYVVVALLDSIHFLTPLPQRGPGASVQYSVNPISVFDVIVGPLRRHTEQTYSAPFATHLLSKQTVQRPDGTQARVYARLKYGGAHLSDPASQETGDILHRLAVAAVQGALLWAFIVVAVAFVLGRRSGTAIGAVLRTMAAGRRAVPWRTLLGTVLVLLLLIFAAVHLGGAYHVFGTDKVGQDVFYLSLKSIRTGLVIGTLTTLIMLPFAILLGIMAGYFHGWVDDLIQYFYTTLSSIPGVLLIAAAILSIQVLIANHPGWFDTDAERADLRLLALCGILGITSWTTLCRLLRGEALKLREVDFIEAATAFGVRHFTIIVRHILPNVLHIVLIIVVLDFSGLVLAEAVLSYIGVGVDPSTTSWGNMINGARLELARDPMVWWSLAAAFVMMFTLVLAANVFADAVRDAFDPRLRRQ